MKLYRRNGVWYVDFRHDGSRYRWAAFTSRPHTEEYARRLGTLIASAKSGTPLPVDMLKWLAGLPTTTRSLLAHAGLLGTGSTAVGTLAEHLADYVVAMRARELHATTIANSEQRVRSVIEGIGATHHHDIDPHNVERWLRQRRQDGLSRQTSNHYLAAFKAFCSWLVPDRADANPVAHLRKLNAATDRRHDRRALTDDELVRLLDATRSGPVRSGVSAEARYWMWRLMSEIGLLVGELGKLQVRHFDTEGRTVEIPASYARKRGRTHVLPINRVTVEGLAKYFDGMKPTDVPFPRPSRPTDILRGDLKAAGIPYVDDAGRYLDTYALRHTAGTRLSYTVSSFGDLQALMRHATPGMTARYTHPRIASMHAAADALSVPVTRRKKRKRPG